MTRGVLASLLFWLFALPAFGQMAADLARGTPAETVIQKYGWPRGKSVANGRESWLYDRFQVMFEDGKVVSVAYISPTSPGTTKSVPAAAAAVKQDPATVNQKPPGASSTAVPAGSASIGNKTGASTVEPMFSRPVFWGVVIVGALGFGAAIIVPLLVRRGNEKSTAVSASDAPALGSPFRTGETYGGAPTLNGTASPQNHSNATGSGARRRGEPGTSPGTRSHPPTGGTGA